MKSKLPFFLVIIILFSIGGIYFYIPYEENKQSEIINPSITIKKEENNSLIMIEEKNLNLSGNIENLQSKKIKENQPKNKGWEEFIEDFFNQEIIKKKDYIEIFNRIKNEKTQEGKREMVIAFFEVFTPRNGEITKYTDEEISDIVEKAFELIRDESTRSIAIRNASGILSDSELSLIFNEMNNNLTESERDDLSSQYINMRLMNAKNPDNGEPIYDNFKSKNVKNEIKNRSESLSNFFDSEEEKKKIIESSGINEEHYNNTSPPSKEDFERYLNWVRAKNLFINKNKRQEFITEEFLSLSNEQKRIFLISEPEYIEYIETQQATSYLESRYSEYIQAVYENYHFDHIYVSGNLSLFRSIFKYSNSTTAIKYIDNRIKEDIDTYPSTEYAKSAINMIKNEKIYIPSDNFDINDYSFEDNKGVHSPSKLY